MDSFLELNLGVKEVFEEFVSVAKKKDFVLTSIELIFFKKKERKRNYTRNCGDSGGVDGGDGAELFRCLRKIVDNAIFFI